VRDNRPPAYAALVLDESEPEPPFQIRRPLRLVRTVDAPLSIVVE